MALDHDISVFCTFHCHSDKIISFQNSVTQQNLQNNLPERGFRVAWLAQQQPSHQKGPSHQSSTHEESIWFHQTIQQFKYASAHRYVNCKMWGKCALHWIVLSARSPWLLLTDGNLEVLKLSSEDCHRPKFLIVLDPNLPEKFIFHSRKPVTNTNLAV
jgi:hypothetical protein